MNKQIISAITFLLALVNQVSAEDKMTISDFVISAGETKELSITLENEVVYAGFQFDLYLPEGLTISECSKDQARLPETTTLSMAKQADGSYRFFAASMKAHNIIGTSGGIVTVKVTAVKDLASGSRTGYFRNIKLSKADGTGNKYAEMSFPITVLEASTVTAKKGDANGDGVVDVADVVAVVNYILGKASGNFNVAAANINGDTVIDVADVVGIVNIILGKSYARGDEAVFDDNYY